MVTKRFMMVKRAETNAYWMLSPGGDSSPTPLRLRELQGRRGGKEGKAGGWEGVLRDAVFWYDMDNALPNTQHLSGYLHKTYIRLSQSS